MCAVNRTMVKEEIGANRDSSSQSRSNRSKKRSKSAVRSLASGDSLNNSTSSGCFISGKDAGYNSLASTATLTSNGSLSSNSHSSRSPRAGINSNKSPRRSPRHGCLRNGSSDGDISSIRAARQIASLPLASAEDDRRQDKHDRRFSGERGSKSKEGPLLDGNGLYYQPSKASLGINVPTKKPQRIKKRSNSKGAILRRKSHSESLSSSQHTTEGSTSSRGSHSKRSKSCERQDRGHSCEPSQHDTKNKKKSKSPPISRNRKQITSPKSVSALGNPNFHESWPRHGTLETKDRREQDLLKIKRKKESSKTKSSHKKETKVNKDDGNRGVISFLEGVATKGLDSKAGSTRKDRSGGLFKKSSSARAVKRPSAPAATAATVPPKSRERRSSAPAKAFAALTSYRKTILPAEFDYDEDDEEPTPMPPPLEPPKEKVLLDVSELAALEIIRLGKDNSLKLDLFDLMKHLREQELLKNGQYR